MSEDLQPKYVGVCRFCGTETAWDGLLIELKEMHCVKCRHQTPHNLLVLSPPEPVNPAIDRQEAGNHYKDMAIQPVEFCQRNQLNFCESSVIKYVCRHRQKNKAEDIRKAIHFLELLLELEYGKPSMEQVTREIRQAHDAPLKSNPIDEF